MSIKNMKKWVLGVGTGALLLIILTAVIQDKSYGTCSLKISESIESEWINGVWTKGLWTYSPSGVPSFHHGVATPHYIKWCEPFIFALMSFLPLLLFSLLTYWAKDEIFRAWWNFARWFVPVIVVMTILLENAGGGGGWGVASGIFEFAVLLILYVILIVISLKKIVYTYFSLKLKEKETSPEKIRKLKKVLTMIVWGIFGIFFLWLSSSLWM